MLEEAPAPNVSDEFRALIHGQAIAAARAVNYVNAGTVEFIVDTDTDEAFFLEMNTRLQVIMIAASHLHTGPCCWLDWLDITISHESHGCRSTTR